MASTSAMQRPPVLRQQQLYPVLSRWVPMSTHGQYCHRRCTSIAAASKKGGHSSGRQSAGGKPQRGFGEASGATRGTGKAAEQPGKKQSPPKQQRQQKRQDGGKATTTIKVPTRPVVKVSEPLQHRVLDVLSNWEPAPQPLWGTFCGHLEGDWLGQYAAYTPWGGEPEPVWADDSGRYLLHAYSRTHEERDADHPSGGDLLVRTTRRGSYLSELLTNSSGSDGSNGRSGSGGGGEAGTGSLQQLDGSAASGTESAPEQGDDDEEQEGFGYNTRGAVVFDGGTYSVGPLDLGDLLEAADEWGDGGEEEASLEQLLDELGDGGWQKKNVGGVDYSGEEGAEAGYGGGEGGEGEGDDYPLSGLPVSTVVVEQALVQGGQQRLRLVATLKCRRPPGGEIDIEVARLVLFAEHWSAAPPEGSHAQPHLKQPPACQGFGVAAPDMPRASPEQMTGAWNVFGVTASAIREEDPLTGEQKDVWLYNSREERQQWTVPGLGAGGDDGGDDSGGSLWLPGGCVVTFRMVESARFGAADDGNAADWKGSDGSSNGNGTSNGNSSGSSDGSSDAVPLRGTVMSFAWLLAEGTCLAVEREYDAAGKLVEVRHTSAVKGGWSGGRM